MVADTVADVDMVSVHVFKRCIHMCMRVNFGNDSSICLRCGDISFIFCKAYSQPKQL